MNLPPAAIFLIGCLLASTAGPAASAVYRCQAAGEPPRFSQFPCGDGARLALEALQVIEVPPISDAERELIAQLERNRREAAEARRRARAGAARQAERQRQEHRSRCQSVRARQDALDRQRRKGYSLGEARALDREEAALARDERRYC